MAQHDLVIDNASGAAVRADLNGAFAALGSSMKGPNAPPAPLAGMMWVQDDTPSSTRWTMRIYDGVDWIPTGIIDTDTNTFEPVDPAAMRDAIGAAQAMRLRYLTSDTTLTAADDGFLIMPDATGGNVTVTLPAANALGTSRPFRLEFLRADATGNTVTIQRAGTDTFEGGGTTLNLPAGRRRDLRSDAFAVWYSTIDGTPLGRTLLGAADAAAARSAIGATTTGSALMTAADAAAARTAIAAPALPLAASGTPGDFRLINAGFGANYSLPSGGTWAYWAAQFSNSGSYGFAHQATVAAGGTSLGTPGGTFAWCGWAWRIA